MRDRERESERRRQGESGGEGEVTSRENALCERQRRPLAAHPNYTDDDDDDNEIQQRFSENRSYHSDPTPVFLHAADFVEALQDGPFIPGSLERHSLLSSRRLVTRSSLAQSLGLPGPEFKRRPLLADFAI
ncbi:hypothetical protein KM043_012043 [Ampulex compressa]|nr:hypothetical protein KM043_012043 [Ampulex compressa]